MGIFRITFNLVGAIFVRVAEVGTVIVADVDVAVTFMTPLPVEYAGEEELTSLARLTKGTGCA